MKKNESKVNEQYLPTPPKEFWESLRMVRNYLLFNRAEEIFSHLPRRYWTRPTIRDAFDEIDFYLEFVRLAEEEHSIVE